MLILRCTRKLRIRTWFELAPGESASDLIYFDEEVVADITKPIMTILNKTSFFATLADRSEFARR